MAAGDLTPKLLASSTQLGTSTTTLFTVPSGRQYTIKQIVVCNTDGGDRLVTLANGSAATAANCFVYRLPIAASDTLVIDTALTIDAAGTIQGLCDTASKVNVLITGWEREV